MKVAHQIFFLARQKGMFLKRVIKEDGYKIIDVAIMMVVSHKPNASQETIRDITSFDEASIARSLKDLERRGLTVRTVNAENKRVKQVNLTAEGKKITEKFDQILEFWDDCALSDIGEEDRAVLGNILDKALANSTKLEINNMLKEWRLYENE